LDRRTLEAYRSFRLEAEQKGFRHFLEVFNPNKPVNHPPPEKVGAFINDMIVRCLAGVPEAGRPLFLKMVYYGPKAMEELVNYDKGLVVGVLGGSSGTTYDAFKLIAEAQKHGAKVALFGRKINNAENQLAFVEMLRRIVDGQVAPEEAVRAYHGVLQGLGIRPLRSLEEDMQLTDQSMSYAGGSQATVPEKPGRQTMVSRATPRSSSPATARSAPRSDGNGSADTKSAEKGSASHKTPDFNQMSSQERLAYFRTRMNGL
jgi:hypothetical protein